MPLSQDIEELKPRLKEILYRCLEDIRATKAALYLLDSAASGYELVTFYGFREPSLKKIIGPNDDLVDRLLTRRTPFYANGLSVEPLFSERMYAADTDRLLAAPVHSRGRLIGFLDIRDKAAKQPFSEIDLVEAQSIVDQLLNVFANKSMFGQKSIQLSNLDATKEAPVFSTVPQANAGAAVSPGASPADSNEAPRQIAVTDVQKMVEQARTIVGRDLRRGRASFEFSLSEGQVAAVRIVLPAILLLPGVVIASFSAFSHVANVREVAARGTVTDEALEKFDSRLQAWLKKRGEGAQSGRTNIHYPFGQDGKPVDEPSLVSILSAPVVVNAMRGVVLSVGFENAPDREAQARLGMFLELIQQTIECAIASSNVQPIVHKIAERVLEPDFSRFVDLHGHSRRVSDLSDQFARFIHLSASEIETTRVAALVHDAGMRLLDYGRLYRKASLTPDEKELLRQHPVVGAALVSNSGLGTEIATIVLAHHERPDGTGYPYKLAGEEIPLAAKLIHICEAYDAMTSKLSYQPVLAEHAALDRIASLAGKQFDKELAAKFVEMLG